MKMKKLLLLSSVFLVVITMLYILTWRDNKRSEPVVEVRTSSLNENRLEQPKQRFKRSTIPEPRLRKADGVANFPDMDMAFLFENNKILEQIKDEIEIDLEEIFSGSESHDLYEIIDVDGKSKTQIQYQGGQDRPTELSTGFEIRKFQGKDHLIITSKLSESYSSAFNFRQQYHQEYAALLQTRDRINRATPEQVTEQNAAEIMAFTANRELSREELKEAVVSCVSAKFGNPSLLEFKKRNPNHYKIYATSFPAGELLSAVMYAEVEPKSFFPIMFFWDGAKWIAGIADSM